MASLRVTEPNLRLDQVVFSHYGDLILFDAVAEANPHLTGVILSVGDEITLPTTTTVEVEETLW